MNRNLLTNTLFGPQLSSGPILADSRCKRPRAPFQIVLLASVAFGVSCALAEIPPHLVHGPAHTSASPGATFYVDAWPRTIIYKWMRGGTLLTDGPTGTGSFISGAATSELTIRYA